MNLELYYEEQYQEWLKSEQFDDTHNLEYLKDEIQKELKFYSDMDVTEYTLFVKFTELYTKYKVSKQNTLFGEQLTPTVDIGTVKKVKNDIWIPKSNDDYLNLQPELLLCKDNKTLNKIRDILNHFITTGKNQNNIGRNLYYIVRDKVTLQYLGLITISSDYLDLTCRDNRIGWTKEQKTMRMAKHSCVASTLVPTQPFGYNYVGGKLLALLVLSDQIQSDYERIYGDKLVNFTTTSLYGSYSQYTRLKYWKKVGNSNGTVVLKPRNRTLINKVKSWVKFIEPKRYWEWWVANTINGQRFKRDHINRFFTFVYSKLKLDKSSYIGGHKRGVFSAELYENTNEFLREEITKDQLVPKFDNSIEALTNIWKSKYANKRIANLVKNDRIMSDILFYDDILYNDWETVKNKYLKQVGR